MPDLGCSSQETELERAQHQKMMKGPVGAGPLEIPFGEERIVTAPAPLNLIDGGVRGYPISHGTNRPSGLSANDPETRNFRVSALRN